VYCVVVLVVSELKTFIPKTKIIWKVALRLILLSWVNYNKLDKSKD
jgi:predicted membrane GTPase involved in stress response